MSLAYLWLMEVRLTPSQEATLEQLAMSMGRGPDELAQELLGRYLENEARIRAAVERGGGQIARGEGIAHEDVVAHFEKRYGA